ILSPTICGSRPDAFHSLNAGRTISFGLRRALASSPEPPTESSSLWPPLRTVPVTDWWFTSSCSPPGVIAPMQLLSVTGPTVSARSGTLTLLFQCAFRRTSADFPVRSNVERQEGFRRLLEPWEGRGLLRTGKSALRWRCQDATVSPGSAGLRPGLLVRHLRSRRVGDRRSGGGDKTRPRSQASVIR